MCSTARTPARGRRAPRSRGRASLPSWPEVTDDDTVPDPPAWTTAPSDQVAPWRRGDRERLDRAREVGGLPEALSSDAHRLAREVRRLADLHLGGELSDEEFLAAVRELLVWRGPCVMASLAILTRIRRSVFCVPAFAWIE